MNISLNWLKEYISIEKPVNELAHKLTMCGLEIQKISQHEASKDVVLEAEVTTNRPDWLGYIGIAREIGAIMGKKVTYPNESIKIKRVKKNNFDVSIQDNELCPFYSAVLLENIEFGDTPKYIKEYLEAIGIRSINLPVDLSNYVLFEYNQPLHAFDFDKIGNSVIIRRARKGEKFVAINDKEYSLDRNDLVICDENKAIALAGVMGGLQSEVSIKTRNILLESAFFNPVAIRKTSRKLQVMSESSYRFERRIDPMNVVHASNRFVHLLSKHAKIGSISPVITDGALSKKRNKIKLHFAYVNKVLGISIPKTQIKSILNRLEISVVDLKKDVSITLAIPSFRHDLERPIDLIEEIARVYGYDKITETYPVISMNKNKTDKSLSSEDMMRNYALGVGASEIITYTLVNPSFYTLFAPDTLKDAIQIVNPSNKELTHMRPTLFTGMLDVIKTNVHNGQKNIKAFELGRIYVKNSQSKLPREEKRMSIAITGFAFNNWMDHNRPVSFYDIKGMVEDIYAKLNVPARDYQEIQHPFLCQCTHIIIDKHCIGIIGTVHPKILEYFDLKMDIYYCEMSVDCITKMINEKKVFSHYYNFPSSHRDLSIVIENRIKAQDITHVIQSCNRGMIKDILLYDQFMGKQIPKGHKSLTFSIEYQASDRTLSSEEIEAHHATIVSNLKKMFNAKLRD